jgi:hypothetical protein
VSEEADLRHGAELPTAFMEFWKSINPRFYKTDLQNVSMLERTPFRPKFYPTYICSLIEVRYIRDLVLPNTPPFKSIKISRGSVPLLGPTIPRNSNSSMMRVARM